MKKNLEVALWAAIRHSNQRRKGADQLPYINHPLEVSALVEAAGGTDCEIQAALLHDVVEDQNATVAELAELFGVEVAAIVNEVTDDPKLSTVDQKKQQVILMPTKSKSARTVKIADKIANVTSLLTSPPVHWKPGSIQAYALSCKAVVDAGRGTNAILEKKWDDLWAVVVKYFGL